MLVKHKHKCKSITYSLEFLNELKIKTDVECSICKEIFSQESALKLHFKKVHGQVFTMSMGILDEYTRTKSMSKLDKKKENCDCKYYCSFQDCKFNINSAKNKNLPTFHSLKNHFIRIHGEKCYTCSKPQCHRQFAIKSEMKRHEKSCGIPKLCPICGRKYEKDQSLKKHLDNKHTNKNTEIEKIESFLGVSENESSIETVPNQPYGPSNSVGFVKLLLKLDPKSTVIIINGSNMDTSETHIGDSAPQVTDQSIEPVSSYNNFLISKTLSIIDNSNPGLSNSSVSFESLRDSNENSELYLVSEQVDHSGFILSDDKYIGCENEDFISFGNL